jgi:hypothetical protein
MKKLFTSEIKDKYFKLFDLAIIILIAIIPLFTSFNYRINIFLSWEGAYRMANGEIPYRDFGLPLGFGYWMMPAVFFKIFGAQFISLIKAQVFLNIISGLAFRKILKNFNVQNGVITISIFIFCFSYSFMNAWPWYNHTVIVYQFVGLAFITTTYSILENKKKIITYTSLGALFLILSFFTKQDAGFLGILIAIFVTIGFSLLTKKWFHTITLISSVIIIPIIIISLLNESFFYWFNHGQTPHSSRLSVYDLVGEFFRASQWIRFYIIGIVIIISHSLYKNYRANYLELLFTLFILGILTEAAIFQVTSYVPEDNNIFFHSFALSFLLWYLIKNDVLAIQKTPFFIALGACVLLLWSGNYWKYVDRFAVKFKPESMDTSPTGENIVNKTNYLKETYRDGTVPTSEWKESNWYSLKKIKMPVSTIEGINRIKAMPELQNPETKKVLNMSELTFLAHDIGFKLERGPHYPLWFHLGVGMFNKQLNMFQDRIKNNYYDVVIYEHLPHLNNFNPLVLRDQLQEQYELKDVFLAPRDPTNSNVEVYVRKSL